MRLAHLSDVHISSFQGAKFRELFGKRILGSSNLLFNRSGYLGGKASRLLEAIRSDILSQKPDGIIITGDLTSLSLPKEFALARAWVESLGSPSQVMVIPGNHDYYAPDAIEARRFETYFASYLGETPSPYPVVKNLGNSVVLIGLSSATKTTTLGATGYVDPQQLERAAVLLDTPEIQKRFIVLALHHPPDPRFQKGKGRLRSLLNTKEVLLLAAKGKVNMILHGHEHGGTRYQLYNEGEWRCEVFDAGSVTALSSKPTRSARYNLYTFDPALPRFIEARVRVYNGTKDIFEDQGMPRLHPLQQKISLGS